MAWVPPNSIFVFLHEHRDRLFPDGMFSDLFAVAGRRSVPPSVAAVVMVLQRLDGLSDREAVDRFTLDARWRYAAGAGGWQVARVGLAARSWSTCVNGCAVHSARIGSSRSGWPRPVRSVAWPAAGAGFHTGV